MPPACMVFARSASSAAILFIQNAECFADLLMLDSKGALLIASSIPCCAQQTDQNLQKTAQLTADRFDGTIP